MIKQFKRVSCNSILLELYSSTVTARNINAINLIANVYRMYSFSNYIMHIICSYYFSHIHTQMF
jgi:hypothetical protein